jgi:hypothetical protein
MRVSNRCASESRRDDAAPGFSNGACALDEQLDYSFFQVSPKVLFSANN